MEEAGLESRDRRLRVVVAGQIPPPIGGQNLMVKLNLDLLSANRDFEVEHWRFRFTRDWSEGRRPGFWKILELIAVAWRLIKLRLKGRIDFVLYPAGGPHTVPILRDVLLLPLARLASRRVCLQFHAAGVAGAFDRMWAPLSRLCRWLFRASVGEAVVLTEFGRRDAESIGIKRIGVIPNAIEDRCPEGPPSRAADSEVVTLLNVGHLCPDKGTPELVRAFGRILPAYPGLRLRLVGECLPPYSDEQLDSLISELDLEQHVDRSGVLRGADLDSAFSASDLFVFPTVAPYESFGLVMVEAMMWGLPVVASQWRANVEVLGPNPGGICFGIGERLEVSMAEALSQALAHRNEWPEWGSKNRRRFDDAYRVEVLQQNLEALVWDRTMFQKSSEAGFFA